MVALMSTSPSERARGAWTDSLLSTVQVEFRETAFTRLYTAIDPAPDAWFHRQIRARTRIAPRSVMTETARQLPWSLDDIDFSAIEPARVRDDDAMFLLVCSASFVESGSDTYTGNLLERFAGDGEVGEWLREHW